MANIHGGFFRESLFIKNNLFTALNKTQHLANMHKLTLK